MKDSESIGNKQEDIPQQKPPAKKKSGGLFRKIFAALGIFLLILISLLILI